MGGLIRTGLIRSGVIRNIIRIYVYAAKHRHRMNEVS